MKNDRNNSMIQMVGIGFHHAKGSLIDRPRGIGVYVFLHFLVPVEILTSGGIVQGNPGDCLIYGPRNRQWYRGKDVGLGNNWFHAFPGTFGRMLRNFKLPLGTLIRPGRSDFIVPLLTEMKRELLERRPYHKDNIEFLCGRLLLELARHVDEKSSSALTPRKHELIRRFREVRFEIHSNFMKRWTVSEMAKISCISPSRFAALYKEFFGKSPVDDLVDVRIDRAKWLLSNSHLAVADAAAQSGFENICYFSRMFRKRTGLSPRAYGSSVRNP